MSKVLIFIYEYGDSLYRALKIPSIEKIELLRSNKEQLFEYLRNYDTSLRSTDTIDVVNFEYGIKILYYHYEGRKPYKTRVYLNKMGDTELLR
ncbi:MAG: hypothetical protein WA364_15680 [Candidatus Nitrosopolaris sp.]